MPGSTGSRPPLLLRFKMNKVLHGQTNARVSALPVSCPCHARGPCPAPEPHQLRFNDRAYCDRISFHDVLHPYRRSIYPGRIFSLCRLLQRLQPDRGRRIWGRRSEADQRRRGPERLLHRVYPSPGGADGRLGGFPPHRAAVPRQTHLGRSLPLADTRSGRQHLHEHRLKQRLRERNGRRQPDRQPDRHPGPDTRPGRRGRPRLRGCRPRRRVRCRHPGFRALQPPFPRPLAGPVSPVAPQEPLYLLGLDVPQLERLPCLFVCRHHHDRSLHDRCRRRRLPRSAPAHVDRDVRHRCAPYHPLS